MKQLVGLFLIMGIRWTGEGVILFIAAHHSHWSVWLILLMLTIFNELGAMILSLRKIGILPSSPERGPTP